MSNPEDGVETILRNLGSYISQKMAVSVYLFFFLARVCRSSCASLLSLKHKLENAE
jgi:hypothetical protein